MDPVWIRGINVATAIRLDGEVGKIARSNNVFDNALFLETIDSKSSTFCFLSPLPSDL